MDDAIGTAAPNSPSDEPAWWRRAVVYQIYPRSFADGDGDGTGDLAGVLSRLPYLRDLGVDAVWFNPWFASPLLDGGYDVADYREINPLFGTTAQATELIAAAHDAGIKVIIDLVPNHTSSAHEWFREAVAAAPGSPARRRFHIRDGRGPDGSEPPNNWQSRFGGSAWDRLDDGQWYLHLFDTSQPDLDWTNDEVRAEFDSILRFWLDRDVDGFRVDVAHGLMKDETFRDYRGEERRLGSRAPGHPHWDRDEVHPIIRRWRSILDDYDDVMMVAEAWVRSERLADYLRPDEYHQSFSFSFLEAGWSASKLRTSIDTTLEAATSVGSTPTWVLSNHDVVRHATRYGLPPEIDPGGWLLDGPHDVLDAELGARRARAAMLLTLALPGSAYMYQGDELGLPEVFDLPEDVLDDPVWSLSRGTSKGRDGCRVPLPWTRSGPSYGFGSGGSWLPQPSTWSALSVEAQEGVEGSALEFHRAAVHLRADHFTGDEAFEWLDVAPDVVAFRRGSGAVVVINCGTEDVPLPDGEMLLASGSVDGRLLPPDTGAWLI